MKILFKFPTKGRPERFFEALNSIYENIINKIDFFVLVTCADYDLSMNNNEVINKINSYENIEVRFGENINKVQAVNRELDKEGVWKDFDILICMSDDMRFIFYGFDDIIRTEFSDKDFDKLLHIPDQDAKEHLATMYIAGKTYFNRFGYIYHPSYKSLWCDNEVQDIAKKLNKYKYSPYPGIIKHLNPAYGHLPRDPLFDLDQSYWQEDEKNYNYRKSNNFFL